MNADSYRRKAAISRLEEQAAEKTVTEKREDKKNLMVAVRQLNLAFTHCFLHAPYAPYAPYATAKPAILVVADRPS
jgi:hypothetical protein